MLKRAEQIRSILEAEASSMTTARHLRLGAKFLRAQGKRGAFKTKDVIARKATTIRIGRLNWNMRKKRFN